MSKEFSIEYRSGAVSDIQGLDAYTGRQILDAIMRKLKTDPLSFGKPLRFTLRAHRSLRVGDYRIIYIVEDKIVTILAVFHRREGYPKL